MSRHFLFLGITDRGHVFPHLALVEELVRRGNRVTYATGSALAPAVEAVGATVLPYESEYDLVDSFEVVNNDFARMPVLLLEESITMLRVVEEALADDKPDVIAYDIGSLCAGRLLSYAWDLPAIGLSPFYATNEKFSYLHAMLQQQDVQIVPPEMGEWVALLTDLLTSYGIETSAMEWAMQLKDFYLVHLPRAFQFEGDSFDERYAFVGLCLSERNFADEWQRPADGLPIALVSLGTVFNNQPEFFRTCIKAFTGQPWHLVLTVGPRLDPASLGPLPPNVEVHQWLPHMPVLKHASVLVNHGGIGSIMEALYWGRPLVIVPLSPTEGPTGRRIVELGLGETIQPAQVTPERLLQAVTDVTGNEDIQQHVADMRQHIIDAGGTTRAVNEVEAYLERYESQHAGQSAETVSLSGLHSYSCGPATIHEGPATAEQVRGSGSWTEPPMLVAAGSSTF
jgi:dTDP-L-oleandrosyltransferase